MSNFYEESAGGGTKRPLSDKIVRITHKGESEVGISITAADGEEESTETISCGKGNKEISVSVAPILMSEEEQGRISVTLEEIQRRIEPPEEMCFTNLLRYLRLRFNEDCSKELEETLAENGLTVATNRTKVTSAFSRLTETGSANLAEDFSFLATRSIPTTEIGHAIASENKANPNFSSEAALVRSILEQIVNEVDSNDTDLNAVTHGFSPLIIKSVVDVITDVLRTASHVA